MPMHPLKSKRPSFTELGTVRLGKMELKVVKDKKTGQDKMVQFPVDTDHFLLHDAPELLQAYGDNCNELLIYLPFPTVEMNMSGFYELYKGKHCVCRGNGENIVDRVDPGDGISRAIRDSRVVRDYTEQDSRLHHRGERVACQGSGEEGLYQRCLDCKPKTRLIFIARDPRDRWQFLNDRVGFYRLSSTSQINYAHLDSQLETYWFMAQNMIDDRGQRGTLAGIPLILRRVPREVPFIGKHKDTGQPVRSMKTSYLLDLEPDPESEWAKVAARAMYQAALGSGRQQLEAGEQRLMLEGPAEQEPIRIVEPTGDDIIEPGDERHDWNWLWKLAVPELGYTVASAKRELPENFIQTMTPDQCYEHLRQIRAYQQLQERGGAPGQQSFEMGGDDA